MGASSDAAVASPRDGGAVRDAAFEAGSGRPAVGDARSPAPGDAGPDAASLADSGGGGDAAAGAPSEPERIVYGEEDETGLWQLSIEIEQAALLSVHGQSAQDVWVVGADDGRGPVVLRLSERRWERVATGLTGVDLWWVHTLPGGTAFMGGGRATVLRYGSLGMEDLNAPGGGEERVWGVWAPSADEVYAVGASATTGGFVWHYDAGRWAVIELPELPKLSEPTRAAGLFKVWGRTDASGSPEVWIVGGAGVVLRGNAADGFVRLQSGVDVQLVGLGGDADSVWTLGGEGDGVALRWSEASVPTQLSPLGAPLLQGLALDGAGGAWVVGLSGVTYRYAGARWALVDNGLDLFPETLHSAWADPTGGVWAVGGAVFSRLDRGVLLHRGAPLPPYFP